LHSTFRAWQIVGPVPRLHREKLALVLDQVVAGGFAAGEMLPREVDLAQDLNVSRGVAREVVRALEERGVVVVKHGSGATITPVQEWDILDPDVLTAVLKGRDGRAVLSSVHEPRLLLEPSAARIAAERAPAESQLEVQQAFERLDALPKRDHAGRGIAELDLHRAIVHASGNLPLGAMLRPLFAGLEAAAPVLGRRRTSGEEHGAIAAAIAERDGPAAEEAMTAHLTALASDIARSRRPLL
jgi:DNA-binding FadR family transcriptional regulator